MKTDITDKWLPVYEALASNVRIKIIQLLAKRPMNIKELAMELGLSSAIVSMHIKKLETGHIVKSERTEINGSSQKLCFLSADRMEINFPKPDIEPRKCHEFSIPIGQYTDFEIMPTCGLATCDKIIGEFDNPIYFWDIDRVKAGILWFSRGYVEYMTPNYLLSVQEPDELFITLEIGSEAPGVNSDWPSDITFFLNDINIGMWTSPGDFGEKAGHYTPKWWSLNTNQYGFYKVIKIDDSGTYIDDSRVSDVTLAQVNITQKFWKFKLAVLEDSVNKGGLTIFGKGFGNYNQDIDFVFYYK